jgi:hypothetical protein
MLLTTLVFGQTEAEMKVQADKLFDNGQYLEATPLYLRLLSLQPRDANYNYRYGTCLLFNSNNKSDAIKYLGYSINEPTIAPEAFYFLGKAFHLNYQFNEAIKHYTTYNEKKAGATKKFDADREIQMCMNGKRLMTTISDLIVVDKKEISTDKFFRIYDLNDIGGSMLVTQEFQTKIDKRNNHIPLIHFPQNPSVIYYSSYGESETNGKDIYVRRRLPDGGWGMPQALPGNVNTKFDEDFPYMHPDGNYLYFSSKGHNSMGGYDVFRSKYDPESNSFGPPENMDFAISSPDDDLFYIVDSLNKNAYFASARQSQDGKLFVYKVKVDRVPLQLAVVKGNFVSEIDATNKRIDFDIKDYSNGENIGKFNSNDKAVYLITFPKGGKYEFIMRVEGSPQEFRSVVSIPFLKEFKPLKQKIIHKMEEGKEVVKIINLFNEEVEDPQAVIAEVIKMRSNLNVNVQDFDMNKLEEEKKNQEFLSELGFEALLMVEVSSALADEVERARKNKQEIEQINSNINNLVVQNGQDFARKEEQIKAKVADANKTENQDNKYILLREADQLIKKQTELKESSKRLIQLQDSVNLVAKASSTAGKIEQLDEVAKQFDKLYREGKEEEAIAFLKENKELVRNALNDNSTELKENIVARVVKLEDELSSLSKRIDGYNKDIKELEIEVQALENSRFSAKKKDLEIIDGKIASKKDEIEMIRAERIKLEKKTDVLSTEKYLLNKQIEELETALTNPSLAKVTREEANRSIQETNKTNANTLTNYVQQQIVEMEKQDPTLRERIVVSSGMKAENIMAEHRTLKQRVEETPGLTKEERLNRLINTTNSTRRALQDRLTDVENQLAKNKFDEKLNKEKQQIIKDLEQLEREIALYQQELMSGQNSAIASKDPKEIQQQIDPGYNQAFEAVMNDSSLSEEERLIKQQQLDKELVRTIDEKIQSNEKRLKADPGNTQLKKDQQALNQLKEQKQNAIIQRETAINEKTSQTKISYSNDDVINKVDPAYIERFTAIQNDRSKSEIQRFTELQKEEKQLVARLNDRGKLLEQQIKNNPQDKTAITELEALKNTVKETEVSIAAREKAMSELNSTPSIVTKVSLLNQVDPAYDGKINAINSNRNISQTDRLKQLNKEDQELLAKIETLLTAKEAQLRNDSSNEQLQKEIDLLNELKREKKDEIEQRNKELQSNITVSKSIASLEDIDPEYKDKIKSTENNRSKSETDRLKELNILDQELLDKIESLLTVKEEQLRSEASNEQLQKEVALLIELKREKKDEIEQRNKELQSNVSDPNAIVDVKDIDPEYVEKIEVIESNADLTEKERLIRIQAIDKALVEDIDERIEQVEQSGNTDDPKIDKVLEQLRELKMQTEAKMEEREKEIERSDEIYVSSEQLIAQIDPTYAKDLEAINANTKLNEAEKIGKTQVREKELLNQIDQELIAADQKLNADPKNTELISRKEQLSEIKTIVEARIEERVQLIEGLATTDLTSEKMEAMKKDVLKTVDPGYEKKKSTLESAELSNKPYADLIGLEEKLLSKLQAEKSKVNKTLDKDPTNQEAIWKTKALNELIEVTQSEKEKWEQAEQGEQPIVVTESEKQELIAEIDPPYNEQRKSFEASNVKGEEELKDQLARENELLSEINARISADQNVLSEEPDNEALAKEIKILESIKEDLKQRISDIENVLSTNVAQKTYTKTDLIEKINDLDPEYSTKLRSIETDQELSETEKLEELNTLDRLLQNQVLERINELESRLNNDPGNAQLKEEKRLLEAIAEQLEGSIDLREKQIESLRKSDALASGMAEEWIDQLDKTYRQDVKFIEENASFDPLKRMELIQQKDLSLLSKVDDRLEALSRIPEPTSTEVEKEEKALIELKEQLLQRTEIRAEEIIRLKSGDLTTGPKKADLIEELIPGFNENKKVIETDNGLNQNLKKDMIVQLEEALQQKTEQRVEVVNDRLTLDPTDVQAQKEKEVLEEIISESKIRVKEMQSERLISQTQRDQIINELFPDYFTKKDELAISRLEESKKIDAQLAMENQLLTKLNAELKAFKKELDRDPNNEGLIEKIKTLNLLIEEQEKTIRDLNQRKIALTSVEVAETAIRNADKTYEEDLKQIEMQPDSQAKRNALAEREAEHQERLIKQITANDKLLDKKADPELQVINNALNKEVEESQEREVKLRSSGSEINIVSTQERSFIENLREDLLSGNANQLTAKKITVEELRQQDEVLAQYEKDLNQEIESLKKEIAVESENTELKQELEWLKKELSVVQQKRREISITVGELETELITERSSDSKVTSPELQKLGQEEQQIQQQLKQPALSSTERKQLEKQLQENRSEQLSTENELLKAEVATRNKSIEDQLTELTQNSNSTDDPSLKLTEKQVSSEIVNIEQLVSEAEKTKNPAEKNFLLNEAFEKQVKVEALVENALYEKELKRIENENGLISLESRDELEKKKRRYTIEVGELTTEIESLNNELLVADKKVAADLIKEKQEKAQERTLVQQRLNEVEAALAALPEKQSTLDPASKDVVISYNEERDLASTRAYAQYVEKVNEALRVEQQIVNLEKQLVEAKSVTKALAADNLKAPSEEKKKALEESIQTVKQLETQLREAEKELEQKQQIANAVLPQNTEEAMMMQNLVRRGIAPISKALVAAALVPMPASGLEINTNGPGTYSETNRIPVNVSNPQGLVYRVQVGAFAKPIEQNRFKEFTPVSGETLNNGITRYMAGYFNNSAKVLQAMNQIRALGYADAFPVAYCDGKRISLAEARRLEASGECVPKGSNELMLEMATNTAVTMGLEDTTKLRNVPEYTYNQAPGAAKAEPIEIRKGLFFTVQIGVYNKPVPSATLFNLEPYMTIRLPNGQIRYSTGIYHSIDEARPRKQEAINRGVKDAFITAYFNGERIPINDALKMLEERGPSILEPKEKQAETSTVPTNNTVTNPVTNPVTFEKTEAPLEIPQKPKIFMQIVTKKQFETFPTDVLNRYNSHGSFYYDETDKRVKSSITTSDDNLPQVYYFRDDVDTLKYISATEFMQGTILSLTFAEGKLPGDVVDWLLRQNYRKEYLQSEEGVTMLIHGVPEEKYAKMEAELAVFGMSFTKVAPKEEEELNKE